MHSHGIIDDFHDYSPGSVFPCTALSMQHCLETLAFCASFHFKTLFSCLPPLQRWLSERTSLAAVKTLLFTCPHWGPLSLFGQERTQIPESRFLFFWIKPVFCCFVCGFCLFVFLFFISRTKLGLCFHSWVFISCKWELPVFLKNVWKMPPSKFHSWINI